MAEPEHARLSDESVIHCRSDRIGLSSSPVLDLSKIEDVIAHDTWTSTGDSGETMTHEIVIGRPFCPPDHPNRDWVCLISIDNFTPRITPIYGVGPVDALMNAMALVRAFFAKINSGQHT